ncbi:MULTISPECIES: hypothetical protein [unclassified Fusibacter]|uniref:hypothetical protein n=1 Tax=unclassified Fusibacter TaxID=2624464 RepID=UPI0010107831|nr:MULTISPECIES: hypothetical protein [unclassified Fusibacter]MCK8060860.1 hypothetical protein [Fusibacter sp. A2]NPE23156.1 hypothetical protein [Fusibacter sp. A1]RXV59514.1 hypothetical protein DWB64_15090 [Fusibacter sp. A1]
MYKVKQIADMLGVETVVIHEKLIVLRDLLEAHIRRKNGVIYLDNEGYRLLSQEILKNVSVNNEGETDRTESLIASETVQYDDIRTDVMQMMDKISSLKQEINKCDMQIIREEEALNHYVEQMKINMERLKQSEADYFIKHYD